VVELVVAALLLRGLAFLPLASAAPDLGPWFRREPLLGLLDIFGGGGPARFSALGLGLYPYLVGRAAAGVAAPLAGWWRFRTMQGRAPGPRAVAVWTVVAAVAMGAAYVLVGAGGAPRGRLLALADVLTLATASMVFLELGRRLGVDRVLAVVIVAAAPPYLLHGARSWAEVAGRLLGFAVVVTLALVLSQTSRRIPLQIAAAQPREPRRPRFGQAPVLPVNLALSGVIPLLALLAALGAMRLGALRLQQSDLAGLRRLAGRLLSLTDAEGVAFWLTFAVVGAALKMAYATARFNARITAQNLQRSGTFIPGVRPGETTARYLQRTLLRVGWIEPVVTMGALLGTALLSRSLSGAAAWALVLVPALFAVQPMLGLVEEMRARRLAGSYEGLVRRPARLGGP
jgi:preprotein translocase subunit SecY